MNIDYIKNRIVNKDDIDLIEKAFKFTNQTLSGIYYSKDETLIDHILGVTNTLIDFKADNLTLVSSILYETIRSGVSRDEMEKEFGSEITNTAFSTFRINMYDLINDYKSQKYYLELLNPDSKEDTRTLFIRLADRLYNMKKLNSEQQIKVARETLDILIPTAQKFRLSYIKSMVEDLCLLYLKPQVYNNILNKLTPSPDILLIYLNNIKEDISSLLTENNINFVIKSRVKNIYSIYSKIMNGKKFEEIYDILALRVIVEDEVQCSRVLELIHSKYSYLPFRIKDYINNPKDNMYQSLHTTIIGDDNRYYEIQIRTDEMNKNAEFGNASHHLYKEKTLKKIV